MNRSERAQSEDRYYDYCLWEYEPLSSPAGKLRSVSVLNNSILTAGAAEAMFDVCDAIRANLGDFQTVWGVKQVAGKLSWELYFYDYRRTQREVSISRLLRVLSPFTACCLSYPEQRPYFMFSLDLDEALLNRQRELDEINVYVGNVGSSVSSGICYAYTKQGLRLDNFYFFFDAHRELDDVAGKITSSAHLDPSSLDLRQILWPELIDCKTIVVANKRLNEGIYFSRVHVGQLLYFLRAMVYPQSIVSFVEENQAALDHLLFDVAFDYVMEDGRIKLLKSSYYGYF